MTPDPTTLGRLTDAARAAARNAYCPYSDFAVGAAVLADDGAVYAGCNVENTSYGLTVCAERNAIAAAVTAGARSFEAVLIYTATGTPTPPCGACRQVLREFVEDMPVYGACEVEPVREWRLSELLPEPFVKP